MMSVVAALALIALIIALVSRHHLGRRHRALKEKLRQVVNERDAARWELHLRERDR